MDSLEKNIKDSLNFLGTNVIYVEKCPYTAEADGEYRWWEYWRRPTPSLNEFKFLQASLKNRSAIGIFAAKGGTNIKRANNSIGQIGLRGAGNGYDEIFEVNIENGRYLTGDEVEAGRNVGLIGYEVAKALFPKDDPIGEIVKISNLKFKVVGTIKKEGESFLGTPSNDYTVIIPLQRLQKIISDWNRYAE